MGLIRLTKAQTEKIQIDEGIVVLDLGETSEKVLGPTRGGAEFTATPTIRDIEYDGRKGKTKGLQVKDGEDVLLKVASLDCSQEVLKLAIPNSKLEQTTKEIKQSEFGLIKEDNYLKNVAIITKTLDGKFKILTLKNPMHEGAFGFKATSKAENEHNLEFIGHYDYTNPDDPIWSVKDADTNPIVG
jgi:hypothetical protein